MADISQTAANVATGSTSTPIDPRAIYGESITQGQPLYRSTSDGRYYRCDANDGAAKAVVAGIALTPGTTGSPGIVALPGTEAGQSLVNLGATLAVGQVYAVSTNVGGIAPYSDLGSTNYVTILGVATTAALLDFQPIVSGIQKA
jgi:hypothetical protein